MAKQEAVGIGTQVEQQNFLTKYDAFIAEYAKLLPLIGAIFLNRTLKVPGEDVMSPLAHLPDDDPQVVAVSNKYLSDQIIFTLGRIAVDDFSELIVLAGNGWGIGALKTLRGIYERVVHSAYFALKPETAPAFAASFWTHKSKVWRLLVGLNPKHAEKGTPEDIEKIMAEAKAAQEKKKESVCKCCGQIKKVDAWTALDLFPWRRSRGNYSRSCICIATWNPPHTCMRLAQAQRHELKKADHGWIYRINTEDEAEMALVYGHKLLLYNLKIQNDHFDLGLAEELQARCEAWALIWDAHFAKRLAEMEKAEQASPVQDSPTASSGEDNADIGTGQ